MEQRRGIILSCTICILIMAVVAAVSLRMKEDEKKPIRTAEESSQLELFVEFSSGIERINMWQDEAGDYVFFLPAGAAECRVTFGNLGGADSVRMDDQTFGSQDDLRLFLDECISSEEEKILVMEKDGIEEEPVCVRFLQSENIPAMFIDTESGTLDNILSAKGVKEAASMRLWDSSGEKCYGDSIEYIKGRGNSTWQDYDKKPYQIKLNKKTKLLGMPSAKRWILLANILDDTLIKNELVFRYAEEYTTVPSIEGEFVDLYINGDYGGNYYLCEKIEVSDNRLDITDLEKATEKVNRESSYDEASLYVSEDGCIKATQGLENPADITGGYLLEAIPPAEYEEAANAFRTQRGHCYSIESPSPATVEQAEYICGLFNEMEEAAAQEDKINPDTGRHISEYLDLDSWASKYVMEVVFHDPDAREGSMYFYKDSDSVDPRIYSGPMWDYDRALGSYGVRVYRIDDPRQVRECSVYAEQLLSVPEVRELVNEKFEKVMAPYIKTKVQADIYDIDEQIRASAEMDLVRWSTQYGYYDDRDASLDYLIWFLKEKSAYLQDVWLGEKEYCTVTFLDYNGNVCETYHVKSGECVAAPSVSSDTAVFAGWYVQGEGIPYEAELPVLEDVTYESRWIDMAAVLQGTFDSLGIDPSQVDPEVFENMADVIRGMQENADAADVQP